MKTYTLICDCGKTLTIRGKDVEEVLAEIDKSGWQDHPRPALDECSECTEKNDIEYSDYGWDD